MISLYWKSLHMISNYSIFAHFLPMYTLITKCIAGGLIMSIQGINHSLVQATCIMDGDLDRSSLHGASIPNLW